MHIKDFDKWNNVKKNLNKEERKITIRRGEIRWVSLGINIGSEIDGKGESFSRPALIVHVIGNHFALVIPMSTKIKDIAGYVPFEWKDKTFSLCVHQTKVVSQKRILRRLGRVSDNKLQKHKDEIKKFFSL